MRQRTRSVILHGNRMHYLDYPGTGRKKSEAKPGHSDGDDLVLLLHGIAGSARTFEPVFDELAARGERRRVIAPDLLGHGESATPRGDYSLGAFASSVRDLISVLGYERATVLGHSLGGGVAMQFAYQFPQQTQRLVLVSSGGLGRTVSPALRAVALPGAEWVLPWLAHRHVMDTGRWLGRMLSQSPLPMPHGADEIAHHFASLAEAGRREAFIATARGVIDLYGQKVSATDRLYLASEVPTLVIWGDHDHVIPVGHAYRAAEAMPGSRLEIFEGASHFPHVDAPKHFADVFTDFLQTTKPANLNMEDLGRTITMASRRSKRGVH